MLERIVARLSPLDKQANQITEIANRSFKRETLLHGQQTLELILLEARFIDDERITPPNWQEQVTEAIEHADLVFMEYFPPELKEVMPYFHDLGEFSRNIAETYGAIADIAHKFGTPVAITDIANRPLYEAYQLGVYPVIGAAAVASARYGGIFGKAGFIAGQTYIGAGIYQSMLQRGKYSQDPGLIERLTPDATDARRTLTARGIAQTAREMPANTSLLYIGAPAHVSRIKAALTEPITAPESAKAVAYKHLPGLDRTVRMYYPVEDGWDRAGNHPIR